MKKILIPALLCLTLAAGCTCENTIRRRADVLVIGGTTSGTTAAIAAARQGVQTLVVEETPMLGGMLTAQGVCATDGNFDLPSGLWNEFRDHLRKRYGGIGALWTGWVSTTLFEPHVADSIFHTMAAAEPTLEVVHGYRLTGILRRGKRVTGAEFTDARGGRMLVRARITVDATDLGDALPLSGTSYRLGMDARADTGEELAPAEANDAVQDLTVVAILKDYGPGADRTIERPAGYAPAEFAGCYDLSSEGVRSADRMLEYGRMPGGKYMINWPKEGNDINLDVVELPHAERTAALEAARQKTLRFVYHIQHELGYRRLGIADDEFDTPDGLAYLPYHREGRRMDGVVRMTLDDVTDRYARPLYRTGISVGDYPVDHHRNCRTDLPKILFPPVPSFSVPLGALIPDRTENFIVSDKAISVSNLVNGSTRLQPVVMLTGQAAGTLAALAAERRCPPREVPVREVQEALLAQKAYIAPLHDVKPDDPDFATLQRIAATGILRMTGEPFHWANRSWFYPERTIPVGEFTRGLHDFAPRIPVRTDTTALTAARAAKLIAEAGGKAPRIRPADADRPLTRRKLALLLEECLDPFARPVDLHGEYR